TPWFCDLGFHMWTGLPFGHTYQTVVVDHSSCGSSAAAPIVQTFQLNGTQFNLQITPATTGNNGALEVFEVIPTDPDSLPLPMPLTGSFLLFELPADELVGSLQVGSSASWSALSSGEYRILFAPDGLVSQVDTIITIGIITSLDHIDDPQAFKVWPNPASDQLMLPGIWEEVIVTDQLGHIVLQTSNSQRVEVSGLSPGYYL